MTDQITQSTSEQIEDDPLRPANRYPESTNDYCNRLVKRRWSHNAKGLLLELPRTGMIVVPYEYRGGWWACVVIRPDRNGTYTPGGHSLSISDLEIETAIEHRIGEETNLDDRKVENPNSPFKKIAEKIQRENEARFATHAEAERG